MSHNLRQIDVVVVGGGQAGIALSYHLKNRGIPHVVLERDRPFSSWANRWEGFKTNTPNWMNTLPMLPSNEFPSGDPKAFATREELLRYLERCLETVDPPIEVPTDVRKISQLPSGRWLVTSDRGSLECGSVAICNGAMSVPRLPVGQSDVDPKVPQLHSSEYRSPDQIRTRRVLVVGSASSGVQICRLLAESGRFTEISIAASRVLVLPKRILGVPTHRFLHRFGLFDIRSRSWLGRLMYSGLETKGDPIMRPAPNDLSREFGVECYGRFDGASAGVLSFADGRSLSTEDLTIVWCTGFGWDYGFIQLERSEEAFDARDYPIHVRGVVDAAPGLYFVGLRYQHTVASHDIYGVGSDAAFVANAIEDRERTSHAAGPADRSRSHG
jgi:putative flavoprotein involved in K+ transport